MATPKYSQADEFKAPALGEQNVVLSTNGWPTDRGFFYEDRFYGHWYESEIDEAITKGWWTQVPKSDEANKGA